MQCWGCFCCSRVLYSSNVWSKSSRPRLRRCLLVPRLAAATRVALGARSCHHAPRSCCQRTSPVAGRRAVPPSASPRRVRFLVRSTKTHRPHCRGCWGCRAEWHNRCLVEAARFGTTKYTHCRAHNAMTFKVKNNGMYLIKLSWVVSFHINSNNKVRNNYWFDSRYSRYLCILKNNQPFKGLALITKCKYVSVFMQGTKQSRNIFMCLLFKLY